MVEGLPSSLNTIKDSSELSWLVAESYRKLEQPMNALPYYKKSAVLANEPNKKFTSQFRLLASSYDALFVEQAKGNVATIKKLKRNIKNDEANLQLYWSQLSEKEKFDLTTRFKPELYKSTYSDVISSPFAEMLLWSWKQSLADKRAMSRTTGS